MPKSGRDTTKSKMLYINEDAVNWHNSMKSGRGGKRENAGRPLMGDRPKSRVNITIDSDLVEWIDSQTDNRSAFIEEILRGARSHSQACELIK